MMTGRFRVAAPRRSFFRISSPSSPGSMTSRMTSSAGAFLSAAKSAAPLSQPSASKPVERRA